MRPGARPGCPPASASPPAASSDGGSKRSLGENRVAREERTPAPRVVVDLEVEVVAVELVGAGGEVVVGERPRRWAPGSAASSSARPDRCGRPECGCSGTAVRPVPFGVARRGIVNQRAGAGEVAAAQRVGRNRAERRGALPSRRALPVAEEEQLVLLDRVRRTCRRTGSWMFFGIVGADEEVVARPQRAVGVEPLPAAVEVRSSRT